jgi:hypothetical protein
MKPRAVLLAVSAAFLASSSARAQLAQANGGSVALPSYVAPPADLAETIVLDVAPPANLAETSIINFAPPATAPAFNGTLGTSAGGFAAAGAGGSTSTAIGASSSIGTRAGGGLTSVGTSAPSAPAPTGGSGGSPYIDGFFGIPGIGP